MHKNRCRITSYEENINTHSFLKSGSYEETGKDSKDQTVLFDSQNYCVGPSLIEDKTDSLTNPIVSSIVLEGEENASKFPKNNQDIDLNCVNFMTDEDVTYTEKLKKWNCPVCTYLNWPRSSKCTMCKYVKDQQASSSSTSLCGAIGKMPTDYSFENSQQSFKSHSPDQREFNEREQVLQSITKKKKKSPVHIMQDEYESKSRQVRRWKMDKLWMNACLGVVENQYSAVEEFLTYGGSPTRALTANECLLLNRNSAFDTGHTLIHLAIRYIIFKTP